MHSLRLLDVATAAYVAGLIDSDGAIGIRRRTHAGPEGINWADSYTPRVRVKQVTEAALLVLADSFGGQVFNAPSEVPTRRPSYVWEATHSRAESVLRAIAPYLLMKRTQAHLALEAFEVLREGHRSDTQSVQPGEALVSLAEAARQVGRPYASAYAAVQRGSIPFVRNGRRIYVPESYLEHWQARPTRRVRPVAVTERLDELFLAVTHLNKHRRTPANFTAGSPVEPSLLLNPATSADARLGYLAGVIDADGYIGVYRNDYRARVIGDAKQAVYQPRITVRQVDSAAVDLASEVFGGARHVTAPQREGYQPLETWSLHSSAAVRVCEQLGPLLRIKDQQAQCVVKIGAIHAEPGRRRFDVPEVVEGEPLLSLSEAARRAGRSYAVAIQSVRLANIPFVRQGRSIFVPESFVPVWRDRPRSATRRSDITEKLEVLYLQVKNLNRVGAQTPEASPAD